MRKTRDAVNSILSEGLQLIPAASSLARLCGYAWETLNERAECDNLVERLVVEMGSILPEVAAVQDRVKIEQIKDTVSKILTLVEDASNFVIQYKLDGHAVKVSRMLHCLDAQSQEEEFLTRFGELKKEFDRRMGLQALARTETLLDAVSRKSLDQLDVEGARYDFSPSCLENTRVPTLKNLKRWAIDMDGSPPFLWLYSPLGTGKTCIASSISKVLEQDGLLAGSFFCKRDNEHLRKSENVISSLAASLAYRSYSGYGERLVETLKTNPQIRLSSTMVRFQGLFVRPLQTGIAIDQPGNLVFVVDALDEISPIDTQEQLLQCLLQLSRLTSWLRVLVTSRPTDRIRRILGNERIVELDIFNEDKANGSKDVQAYISSRMFHDDGKPKEPYRQHPHETRDQLCAYCGGSFINARTTCDLIDCSLDPKATLKRIIAGERTPGSKGVLDKIYLTSLHESLETKGMHDMAIVQRCVGIIVLTGRHRPLPEAALAALLPPHIGVDSLSRVIKYLGSVLYKDSSGAVRVLHQTFSEYMTGEDCPQEYRIDLKAQNAELAISCLRILIDQLKFNLCGFEDSRVMNCDVTDLQSRISENMNSPTAGLQLHLLGQPSSRSPCQRNSQARLAILHVTK
ncbi:hypothetical protein FRC07_015091 [Ceratobasidium sp. 392]|nr:hypothetical protein FRC07_015091 [Ceratobasidium sp. 392]